MSDTPACPDCNQTMELGFIPDFGHGTVIQLLWHPGEPEEATILGLKTGGIKVNRSEFLKIKSFRCPDCGLLRSYAS